MILQLIDDGAVLKEILDSLLNNIVTLILNFIVAIFSTGIDWFILVLGGSFFSNPSILLISIGIVLAAWRINVG